MSIEVGTEQPVPIVVKPPSTVTLLQKRVMLTMPWQKMTNPITSFCVQQLADKRRTSAMLNFGDAFVAHARNKCADIFLQSDFEWMLTLDDDMLFPFGNAKWFNAHLGRDLPEPFASFNAIDRLLSHGKTLIGGLYWGRWKGGGPVYAEGRKEIEWARKAPFDKIRQTRWIGTGCLLIHRSVFEDIEKKFPYLARGANGEGGNWFSTSEHNVMASLNGLHKMLGDGAMDGEKAMRAYQMTTAMLAETKAKSSLGMGEDAQLCTRALEAGHPCWVDMGLLCGHIGYHVYNGLE